MKETAAEDGTAVLMVTHDQRIIERANRLIQLVDGRIVSDVVKDDLSAALDASPRFRQQLYRLAAPPV